MDSPDTQEPNGYRIEIHVVEHEGEQLFQVDDLYFDHLKAIEEFEDGKLSIFRNGELLDATTSIRYHGTHGATTCFMGLTKLYGWDSCYSSLGLDKLQVGDVICLDIPNELDYPNYIRGMHIYTKALRSLLQENPGGMNFGELNEQLPDRLQSVLEQTKYSNVLKYST